MTTGPARSSVAAPPGCARRRTARRRARSSLGETGRGDAMVGDRAIDVHISHLRQKLGDDPRAPRLLKTVRGVGYVLVRDEEG